MVSDKIIFIIDEKREFLFDGTRFSELAFKDQKEYFNSVVAPSSDIRTHGYMAEKNISAQKLEMQSEINMYEDGGLNPETEFVISSIVIPLEDDENFVESYAIESSVLDENFTSIVSKYGHIDLIFPPALSYSALYANEILEPSNDLFVYLDDNSAYAVIFKDGNYISTRILASIEEIGSKVNRNISEFKDILVTKGIEEGLYTEDEFLLMTDTQEEISKIVERIAHFISHKRGTFKLDTVDRIFLDFEGRDIPGFLDLFDNYGYQDVSKKILDVFVDVELGMKHNAVNALYALSVAQGKLSAVNFTKYDRRPSFLKSKVGEFSVVMGSAVVLAVIYPLYAFVYLSQLDSTQNDLEAKVSRVTTATIKLQEELKQKKQQRDTLKDQQNEVLAKMDSYVNMLDALQKLDKDTLFRQKMQKDINQAMRKYKLASKKIEFREPGVFNIQVISKFSQRDDIAMFMKELIHLGYTNVTTKKVQKYDDYYQGIVEIQKWEKNWMN